MRTKVCIINYDVAGIYTTVNYLERHCNINLFVEYWTGITDFAFTRYDAVVLVFSSSIDGLYMSKLSKLEKRILSKFLSMNVPIFVSFQSDYSCRILDTLYDSGHDELKVLASSEGTCEHRLNWLHLHRKKAIEVPSETYTEYTANDSNEDWFL